MSENNDQQPVNQDPAVDPSTSASPTAGSPAPASSSAPVAAPSSDQPLPPPAPTTQPVVSGAQPSSQPQPASQPTSPEQPAGIGVQGNQPGSPSAQQPGQPDGTQQPQQPEGTQPPQPPQQPSSQQPEPTFRENGAFSFFATPSDPDDDPAPMSWGFKIGWFVLGLVGGMLGLFMAWLSTSTLSSKRRRQALIWTWAGFAAQAIIFFIFVLTGTSLPFAPTGTGSTAAQSAGSAGTGSSAFG